MCQLPRCEDEGDGLETMPVPIPSKTMPDAPELERKRSLMMWRGNSAPRPDPIVSMREPWSSSTAHVPSILQHCREIFGWTDAQARSDLASGNYAREMSVNSSTFHPQELCRALGGLEVQSYLIMGKQEIRERLAPW